MRGVVGLTDGRLMGRASFSASAAICLFAVVLLVGGCAEAPGGSGGGSAKALIADAGENVLLLAGEPVTLTANAAGGDPPYLFRWSLEDQPDGANLVLPDEVTDRELSIAAFDVEGRYLFRVRIIDSAGTADTDFVEVNVGMQVDATATADAALRVVGDPAQLDVTIADSNGLQDAEFLWEVVRGEATFSDPATRNPMVTLTSDETTELKVSITGQLNGVVATGTSGVVIVGVSDPLPQVVISNSGGVTGDIVLELLTEDAPLTCANFLRYVDDAFYDGVIWHRVVSGFVIQGGAFERVDGMLTPRDGVRDPVKSEAPNGRSNTRGFVAMALRGQDADSGTNQFFVNLGDNSSLDTGPPPFTPFARVVEGLDVVDAIAAVNVGTDSGFMDVPVEDIVMTSVRRR